MTVMEICRRFDLMPKDVTEYVRQNATFPVKRNFQTGEMTIPDNVDIEVFIEPLLDKVHLERIQKEREEKEAREEQEREERAIKEKQEALEVESKVMRASMKRQAVEKDNAVSITSLKKMGAEGYYEYKVVGLQDAVNMFGNSSGHVNTEAMTLTLNKLGMEGWRLVAAYANEVGKNSRSSSIGGLTMGTNSTVDEHILIFERFIKFE